MRRESKRGPNAAGRTSCPDSTGPLARDPSDGGGKAPYEAVKQLSDDRARAVKEALVTKFKFDPNKFTTEGCAWDAPYSESDPKNQALNRRVEISVYQPEQK